MDPVALAALRRSYSLAGLSEPDVTPEPFAQFERWLADAVAAELLEPNAMVLATVGHGGVPSARTVLLKGISDGPLGRGLVFYTNYGSDKGADLAANPHAALVFPWYDLERQVRVVGPVERLSDQENDAYFAARPHGSQLGAVTSQQSQVIGSRDEIEQRYADLALAHPEGTPVPRPAGWGGYRVVPLSVEFWQGRGHRLHDRLRYRRAAAHDTAWILERLSP
jgi:pyridoxamine 5'-phosphate oxidase